VDIQAERKARRQGDKQTDR
jgi:hypothetical protein